VCINTDCPTSPPSYKYLEITPDASAGLYSYGTVAYNSNTNIRPYISKAGLFGAIFSDNMDYYTCEMNRAYGQLNMKSRIYQKRIELMMSDLEDATSICTVIYAGVTDPLTKLSEIIFADPPNYDSNKVILTHNNAAQIQVTNKDLEFKSCPQVY
jgi:hypothetical protein